MLPNAFTLLFVLKACTRAQVCVHALALAVHALAVKLGFVQQVCVGNELLHSYRSAWFLGDSRQFFDEMVDRNTVSWNSMTDGYTQVGDTKRHLPC
jgi:hypothetical protein